MKSDGTAVIIVPDTGTFFFMERKGIMLVKKLKETFEQYDQKEVVLQGWVRTNRKSKALGFIELNDGSCFSNVQIVYTDALNNFDEVSKITLGSALEVKGTVVLTPEAKQPLKFRQRVLKFWDCVITIIRFRKNATVLNI